MKKFEEKFRNFERILTCLNVLKGNKFSKLQNNSKSRKVYDDVKSFLTKGEKMWLFAILTFHSNNDVGGGHPLLFCP